MAATFGLLYLVSRQERSLLDWAAAGFFFFCNGVVTAGAAFKFFPVMQLLIGIANAGAVLGHFSLLQGYREHIGQTSLRRSGIWLWLLVFGAHFVPNLLTDVAVRLPVIAGILTAVDLAAAVLIARSPGFMWRSPAALLQLTFTTSFVLYAFLLVRLTTGHETPLQVLGNDLVQLAGRLGLLTLVLPGTTACALMVMGKKEAELRKSAEVDPMTGWFNRRSLAPVLLREFARAKRTGSGFHLITFDIDKFKSINDTYGHATGDQALIHVTRVVADELRGYDIRFRLGGEEFLILVPSGHIGMLAERLRHAVEASPLNLDSGAIRITISVGCAGILPEDTDWSAVLKRADLALYEAKTTGRNRVAFAVPA